MPIRIAIHLIPRAHADEIIECPGGDILKVRVTAPPVGGRANTALIQLLSAHFKKPKSAFRIVKGAGSRTKIIDMED